MDFCSGRLLICNWTTPAENIENTEKSVNATRAAEIYIYTFTDEADEAANLEDISSDKENSAPEK